MKYPYHVEYTKYGSPVMRLPEGMDLVTLFLFGDVQGPLGRRIFLEEIERVSRGEIPYSEVGGDSCALQIRKDWTTIIDMLPEDEEDLQNEYTIETEELKKLFLAWLPVHPLD